MKTILVDAFNTFIVEGQGTNTDMQALLDTYSNPKIILTNANDEQMVQFGINHVPYPVFTLKHQPDKVNSGYFKKMLEHNLEAVDSARSVGITTYHYDKDKKDLEALQVFLNTNLS